MDSLLANYASSDDEEDQNRSPPPSMPPVSGHNPSRTSSSPAASLFSSLPQPKQASKPAFSSIPKPHNPRPSKPLSAPEGDVSDLPNPGSKLFSSLPQPKQAQESGQYQPKRVVQIRPQISLPFPKRGNAGDDEDDDEDEGEKEKKRKRDAQSSARNTSVHSFLSSLPAAKSSATLGAGALPSSGSARRSVIDTDAIAPSPSGSLAGISQSQSASEPNAENHSTYVSCDFDGSINAPVGTDQANVEYESYSGSYADHSGPAYVGYDNSYGDYYHPGGDQSTSGGPNLSYGGSYTDYGNGSVASGIKVGGKRGRNEIPAEIVEVKQDELMKNRPREDQMKLTGIAFGPSHQPVSSAKGKPTKLHKRKHQIGSLYFDMKQQETELAERRARGFLTKAQTQGKYGW